jgi:hypothetical protein
LKGFSAALAGQQRSDSDHGDLGHIEDMRQIA